MVLLGIVVGLFAMVLSALSGWEDAHIWTFGLAEGCITPFAVFLFWKMKRTEEGYANTALYHVVDVMLIQALLLVAACFFGTELWGGVVVYASLGISALLLVSHIIIGIKELIAWRHFHDTEWARMSLYPVIGGALGLVSSLLMYLVGR